MRQILHVRQNMTEKEALRAKINAYFTQPTILPFIVSQELGRAMQRK
jgi:hypothetical protein